MPAKSNSGIIIEGVQEDSLAAKAGLLPGDRMLRVNGHEVRDIIDLLFYGNESDMRFLIKRGERKMSVDAGVDECGPLGIMPRPFRIRSCGNNCVFCFVSQLPKGLRKTLYLKDEDYRMSFLYGSYITMTNLSEQDKKRIVGQRLSPLYISVHSTDTVVRNRMIGRPNAGDIMKDLKYLADHKIRMHTQIVLCPGHNDGKDLARTISDLYRFYPYVMSIAVVPVGLTAHRKKALRPVEKQDAEQALDIVEKFQSRFRKKHGEHIVFAADEMYIKAGRQLPHLEKYDDLPQIENGVGLVASFLHRAKKMKVPHIAEDAKKRRFVTFTGMSFYPYLLKFVDRLKKAGFDIEVVAVENSFFGKSVSVTGLLTGRDVMKTVFGKLQKDDILLIPDIVMREGDEVFLDDVSRQDVEDILGVKAVVIDSTPKGIVQALAELN